MKVLLISSGIGSWPNDGWGACENLTADFEWALRESGVDVVVLHSDNLSRDLLPKINDFKPDIVHCEYDDYVFELEKAINHFPKIKYLLTTHYAFLSQPNKLVQDGYMNRFLKAAELARNKGLILAVLSEEIASVYNKLGNVPMEKIWIFPNGTRVDKISFTKDAMFSKRAVCLGKIEDRKNQYLLQNVSSIDFVGPISDNRFNPSKANYKGKWTRGELYENLTNYSCLVLMSKAEAHPLVIGEALAAGCSIICNKISAANLPVEMPWISVVEDNFLNDNAKMEKLIEKMCNLGTVHREEIRSWAEANLDWRIRANTYIQKWGLQKSLEVKESSKQEIVKRNTSSLRFALVGPGIMPIPPPGWGAVEQLIWDYHNILKVNGQHVDIINTPKRAEIIARVAHGNYDVVHIHYDVFWDILDELSGLAKLICITTHYPYVEKEEKWKPDGFDKVFSGICSSVQKGVKLFTLSKKDRDFFIQRGKVNEDSVIMMPNGVNTSTFRFVDTPHYGKRSLVLAKVEPRKRQQLTFTLPQVDYIGKGPCQHPNYRGEFKHDMVEKMITDWGNLVLLSDGENDPLVVKEAMAAGMGCVLSETAAFELPKNLGWVTVIPEADLKDPQKINDAIEMNRSLSLPMRKQIRDWVSANCDWNPLVLQYISNVKLCLEKCC